MFSSHRLQLLLVRCPATAALARSTLRSVQLRWIASSAVVNQTPPDPTPPDQPRSSQTDTPSSPSSSGAWNKLKTMIKAFTNGSKLIYKDFKRMREIKGRAKGFFPLTAEKLQQMSNGEVTSPITREEFVFMVNTSKDVKRVLPAFMLFCIPFLGYFAPVIAFAFPQYLLSSHFLTEEQKADMLRKGLVMRRRSLEQLTQSVQTVAQGSKLHELDTEAILKLCRTKLHLSKVPSSHLRLVCSAWGFTSLLPALLPQRKLQQEIGNIFIADMLTKLEGGAHSLNEQQADEASLSRCMFDVESYEERVTVLESWVTETTAKGLKHSYLCHLPLWIAKRRDTS